MALPASDNFPGTTLSANWTVQGGSGTVGSNTITSASGWAAFWNADVFPNDQFSQITLTTIGNNINQDGVMVRATGTGSVPQIAYGARYDISGSTTTLTINKWVPGFTQLAITNSIAFANGDVMRLEVAGTNLTLYKNGVSVLTASDSSLTSGSAGWLFGSGGAGNFMGNWSGGALTSPSSIAWIRGN